MAKNKKRRTKKYRGGANSDDSDKKIGSESSDEAGKRISNNPLYSKHRNKYWKNENDIKFRNKMKNPSQIGLGLLGATIVGLLITIVVKKGKL